MSDMNKTAREFYKTIEGAATKKQKGGYDTQATVRRIEDGVCWVHIPGGVSETPAKLTIAAKVGDVVQVRVANGRAFLVGNASAPPTDNKEAIKAQAMAGSAAQAAGIAWQKAEEATADAERAHEAAMSAQDDAERAQASADAAQTSADNAQTSATTANTAANNALSGLSMVESVVDVVNWFAEHKTASTDTTVDANKTYYSYDTSTGVLTKLDPVGTENPSALGWYELGDAISQYVATHVATTNDGLYVLAETNGWRVLVSSGGGNYPAGVYLIDPNGNVAQQTTVNGVEFNTGRPVKIGDQTAYINFDGNGHITVIGADLTIGGANNVSGVLTVKDANGEPIGTWDNNGLSVWTKNGKFIVDSTDYVTITRSAGQSASPSMLTLIDLTDYYIADLRASQLALKPYSSAMYTATLNAFSGGQLFLNSTANQLYGIRLIGNTSSTSGEYVPQITLQGTTSATVGVYSSNPTIRFSNLNASQNIALVFTDQDSVQAPASLALAGNQGGEYFIAPNIKVTSGLEVGAAKFYTPSETTTTNSGSYITSGSITVHRRGNVGHIYGNITIGSAVASQTTIATIPDGYRPVTTDFFSATNGSFFRVNSNGTLQAQNALTAGNYYFSTTYPLA